MKFNLFLLIFSIGLSFGLSAKEPVVEKDSVFLALESKLKFYSDTLRYSAKEEIRFAASDSFRKYLDTFIHRAGSFEIDLDTIKTVAFIRSPDGKLRIITWLVGDNLQNFKSFGVIQVKEKDEIRNVWLREKLNYDKKDILDAELTQDNWTGGLIYQLYEFKHRGETRYCILTIHLLGNEVNCKSIDVITVEENDILFGLPVFYRFDDDYEPVSRMMFYFSSQATMTLRFEPEKKLIVFDNLVPTRPSVRGSDSYYLPDGTYSSFRLKSKGRWYMAEDFGEYLFQR